jgi:RNA polymerase sigma factor (sigma-70 family)
MTTNSELQVMQRVAQRDRAAAEALFEQYADELYGYIVRRTSGVDAEDILQEVFKRALLSASTFRGEGSIRSWLYGIARHALLERWRYRIDPASTIELMDIGPGPESLLLRGEQINRLVWALERLPDEQAIVLELHRADDLSHQEIARTLGIRAATSRKRLQRALESLGRALASAEARSPEHSDIDSWGRSLRIRTLREGSGS